MQLQEGGKFKGYRKYRNLSACDNPVKTSLPPNPLTTAAHFASFPCTEQSEELEQLIFLILLQCQHQDLVQRIKRFLPAKNLAQSSGFVLQQQIILLTPKPYALPYALFSYSRNPETYRLVLAIKTGLLICRDLISK